MTISAWTTRATRLASVALLLTLLAGCGRRSAPKPVAPPEEEPVTDVAGGSAGTFEIDLPDGSGNLSVSGVIRWRYRDQDAVAEALEAQAVITQPEARTSAGAGRIGYRTRTNEVEFDRRVYLRSDDRDLTIEAEGATLDLTTKRFSMPRVALASGPGARLAAWGLEAELDLRGVVAGPVIASSAGSKDWRLRAEQATWRDDEPLELTTVTGQLSAEGRQVAVSSPVAAWQPAEQQIVLAEGAKATSGPTVITSSRLTYRPAEKVIVAAGETTATHAGTTLVASDVRYDVAARRLTAGRGVATRGNLRVTADRLVLEPDGLLRLTGISGASGGAATATLSAPSGLWRVDSQLVKLSGGVTVAQGESRLTASEVAFDGGHQQITATGMVRLTDPRARLTASRATAPASLASATFSEVAATGTSRGGSWSLTASQATWQRGDAVRLTSPRGRFQASERVLTGQAGQALYDAKAGTVVFEDGFQAESPSDGLTASANWARYELAGKRFTARGQVRANVRGIAIRDDEWTYHLGHEAGTPVVRSGPPTGAVPPRPAGAPATPTAQEETARAVPKDQVEAGTGEDKADADGTRDRQGLGGGQGPQVPEPPPDRAPTAGPEPGSEG